MFEVEIRYNLTSTTRAALLEGATFISEETFTDICFDTVNYALTTQNIWLRSRDGLFNLKLPLNAHTHAQHEIEDEEEIKRQLNLKGEGKLPDLLVQNAILPLYTLKTERQKYKKEGFTIDIDHATAANFDYQICEIEQCVEREDQIADAEKAIKDFAKDHNLRADPVNPKIIALIKQENPDHYALL